jgi:glycine hydroxymethyltransferase
MVMCKDEHTKAINRSIFPGLQGGPLMHIIAGKAICFGEALTDEFKQYGQQTVDNAKTLAAALQAGGMKLVSRGTDNHLLLLDVAQSLGMGGKLAEAVLDQCGITVNKNMIPFDERKPNDPSGIRIGTPALTTRKMGTDEMNSIANWMISGLQAPEDTALHESIHQQIRELCEQFPVPEDR